VSGWGYLFLSHPKTKGQVSFLLSGMALFHVNPQFSVQSMTLLSEMKTKITHHVQSLYGFDISTAIDSIEHNARLARALLTNTTFLYRVCENVHGIHDNSLSPVCIQEPNIGGTPQHQFRHPIIQKAINIMWFQDKDGDGIVFHEYLTSFSLQAIALVFTVVKIKSTLYYPRS
jgi:hypothetical protein